MQGYDEQQNGILSLATNPDEPYFLQTWHPSHFQPTPIFQYEVKGSTK